MIRRSKLGIQALAPNGRALEWTMRYRPRVFIDEKALAYIAGFFDADGSVGVYWKKSKHCRRGGSYVLEVRIVQKRPAVLYWVQQLFGGFVSGEDIPKWLVSSQRALDFLLLIRPYVRGKKDQVRLAIEFQIHKGQRERGKILSDAEFDYRQFISDELKELKRE